MPRQSDSRQRMLRAAGQLLRRQGYAATGWRQVVAEAGAPWGSQAHFFPGGKEELAADALAVEGQVYRDLIAAGLELAHPADMILGWVSVGARDLEASGWADGCPIATAALETAHLSDRMADACNQALTSWIDAFAEALVARGVDPNEARSLGTIVVAGVEGALLLARTARDKAPLMSVGQELAAMLRSRVP